MSIGLGEELLGRAARYIDEGLYEGRAAVSPIDGRLAVLDDGVALIAAFSHVLAFEGQDGLTLVDTSSATMARTVQSSLREWSDAPIETMVYTHGHVDHVGGAGLFQNEAQDAGRPPARVVAHQGVVDRFHRYDMTNGYNARINARQFGNRRQLGMAEGWPRDWVWPDTTFGDRMSLHIAGHAAELRHAKGETDDHAWVWIPDRKIICGGDFLTWVFPNAGNPQKVQRYPLEWAEALRDMAAVGPALFLPAHGLPIAGEERIASVLDDMASALETLVHQTLELMNNGATLDEVVRTVTLPVGLAERPFLRATYDEPEFVVRNIWRMYGGWWDGDPSHLKPAPAGELAAELAAMAGGADRLAARAIELAHEGRHRLASHLAELAAQADPDDAAVHAQRAEVYRSRREGELSLMARGIFGEAASRPLMAANRVQ